MARKISLTEDRNPDGDVRYTPNIASRTCNLRAQYPCHIRGDNPGETEMKMTKLRLVSFGSAKALTRDGMGEVFIELDIQNGKYPTAG